MPSPTVRLPRSELPFFFFNCFLLIDLLLAVLGLGCYTWAFSRCRERGLVSSWSVWTYIAVTSWCVEHGLQELWVPGPGAQLLPLWRVRSSPGKGWNPCLLPWPGQSFTSEPAGNPRLPFFMSAWLSRPKPWGKQLSLAVSDQEAAKLNGFRIRGAGESFDRAAGTLPSGMGSWRRWGQVSILNLQSPGDVRLGCDPCIGKLSWRRAWQPSPGFWPGESHGQRSLVGCHPRGHKSWTQT